MVNPPFTLRMMPFALLLLAVASSPTAAPEPPRGGAQATAIASAEIVTAGHAKEEQLPQEPRHQVRRNAAGQTMIEFE